MSNKKLKIAEIEESVFKAILSMLPYSPLSSLISSNEQAEVRGYVNSMFRNIKDELAKSKLDMKINSEHISAISSIIFMDMNSSSLSGQMVSAKACAGILCSGNPVFESTMYRHFVKANLQLSQAHIKVFKLLSNSGFLRIEDLVVKLKLSNSDYYILTSVAIILEDLSSLKFIVLSPPKIKSPFPNQHSIHDPLLNYRGFRVSLSHLGSLAAKVIIL